MTEIKILRKKLIYKSEHRGCKENDILLGKFTREFINQFSEEDLRIFDRFLNESDLDIFAWICKKQPIPENYMKITELFLNFIYCNK